MKLTPEQTTCLDLFATGESLRINAYAGTGKTSTLTALATTTEKHGVYLAFNRSIADEAAKKFPSSVSCSTMHGMAFRAMKNTFSVPKMTGSINGGYIAKRLNLKDQPLAPGVVVKARGFGFLIVETVKRWQRSGSDRITEFFVPIEGKLVGLEPKITAELKRMVAREAASLWALMSDPKSDMPLGHDGYLKLWALGKPQIDGDYLMLDEAQDTNGVVLSLMREQKAQLVAVGDRHQQIYEWRGARNAMVELHADNEARLSKSFRFGPNVAGFATSILQLLGETVPLIGNDARQDGIGAVEKPAAIISRTNGRLIENIFGNLEAGGKPCVVGGVSEVLTYVGAAEKLMARQTVDNPLEFFGFKDWDDVRVASEMDEGAQELRRWVRLIDKYGTGALRSALEGLPKDETKASVVLSTGHKSKGREWPSVRLTDDFLMGVSAKDEKPGDLAAAAHTAEQHGAELRLFYVASTRPHERLEVPAALIEKMAKLKAKAPAAA